MKLSDKQILDIAEQVWRDASFSDIPLNDDAVKFARDVLAAAAPAPSLSADEADALLGDSNAMAAVADGLESITGNENAALAAVWVRREAQRLASADERANVDTLARVLQTAWAKAEPDHSVTLNPTSYWSTFADMARAALASDSISGKCPPAPPAPPSLPYREVDSGVIKPRRNIASAPVADERAIDLFRSALAWGMTYGPVLNQEQWDEMRDKMALQFSEKMAALASAPVADERAVLVSLSSLHEEAGKMARSWSDNLRVFAGPPTDDEIDAYEEGYLACALSRRSAPVADERAAFELAWKDVISHAIGARTVAWLAWFERSKLASAPVAGEAQPVAWRYWNEKSSSWNTTTSSVVADAMREAGRAVEPLYAAPQAMPMIGSEHAPAAYGDDAKAVCAYLDGWNACREGKLPHEYQAPGSGYAGVTVWVGGKQCTQVVSAEEMQATGVDVLHGVFERARTGVMK